MAKQRVFALFIIDYSLKTPIFVLHRGGIIAEVARRPTPTINKRKI